MTLALPELKVIEHGEPIVLIGTDTLVDSDSEGWRFCWVGIHPVHRRGQWVFVHGATGKVEHVDLAAWPLPVDEAGRRILPADEPVEEAAGTTRAAQKRVTFLEQSQGGDSTVQRLARAL